MTFPDPTKRYYSEQEVCARLNIHRQALYKLIATDRTFPHTYKEGRFSRWLIDDVERYIERRSS